MRVNQFKRQSMAALLVAITAPGFLWVNRLGGQEKSACKESCEVNGVLLNSGWKVPGLDGVRTDQMRAVYPDARSSGEPSGGGVTVLRPKKKLITGLRIHSFVNGQIEIRNQLVIVENIYRFDVDGKAFAYGVRYAWAAKERGKVSEPGKESQVLYYDQDGDGVFETMYQFAGFPFRPPIPEWVKKSVENSREKSEGKRN